MTFALSNEPIDLQLSVHINNLFETYPRFVVLSAYDFLKESQFELIYEEMRPISDTDKMSYAMFNLIHHYGWKKIDTVLTELFNENVEPMKLLKQGSK